MAALGGNNISLDTDDVNLVFNNPALISEAWGQRISFSYNPLVADINLSSLAYTHSFDSANTWSIGLQYLNYGEFIETDPAGNEMGEFTARDYFVVIGRSHRLGNMRLGGSIKWAHSNIASFQANALLMDIGGQFVSPSGNFQAGMVFKNIGLVLSNYLSQSELSIPFDVQLGISVKPTHMPARFSITAYRLASPDLLSSQIEKPNNTMVRLVDDVLSHLLIGTELLISENFQLRAGYNHLISRELRMEEFSGGAGWSFGLMLKIKKFEIAYSRAIYHAAGGNNYFTLQKNISDFF